MGKKRRRKEALAVCVFDREKALTSSVLMTLTPRREITRFINFENLLGLDYITIFKQCPSYLTFTSTSA